MIYEYSQKISKIIDEFNDVENDADDYEQEDQICILPIKSLHLFDA